MIEDEDPMAALQAAFWRAEAERRDSSVSLVALGENRRNPNATDPPEQVALVSMQKSWSAAELLQADFPEPTWIVPDLLPEGLGILGGRPKRGKSWLALQLTVAVVSGTGRFFDREVESGPVLYYALEDGPRRLSIAITLDTYSHVLPGMQSDAAAKVAALIFAE